MKALSSMIGLSTMKGLSCLNKAINLAQCQMNIKQKYLPQEKANQDLLQLVVFQAHQMFYGARSMCAAKMNVGNGRDLETNKDMGVHGLTTVATMLIESCIALFIRAAYLGKPLKKQMKKVFCSTLATIQRVAILSIYMLEIFKIMLMTRFGAEDVWTLAGTKAQGAN